MWRRWLKRGGRRLGGCDGELRVIAWCVCKIEVICERCWMTVPDCVLPLSPLSMTYAARAGGVWIYGV